jgi:arsenite/tail-anchored protein-transporting ATPase
MGPRIILYTGKGGVGKTSVAAGTARRLAASGVRTLIVSTDPAHSLSESLEVELGGEPTPAGERLWGQQVDAQRELERHWSGVQAWLSGILLDHGIDRISAQELSVPPGMDELFSLLVLQRACAAQECDCIIVDCAPTGETLHLLSFPDIARWWIEKVFPLERQILAAAGPLARALLDVPLPGHAVFADVHRLSQRLIEMNGLLHDHERCTIRLVLNPDRMVIGEAMRTFTYLNLYGYLTDAVIVNRVFPSEVDGYFAAWREVQERHLALVRSAFAPVPVICAPYFDQEVVGSEMLDRMARALFDDPEVDPGAVLHSTLTQELALVGDGARLRLAIPFARKEEISVKKIGLELVVAANGHKRTIALPGALAGYRPREARFSDGALEITFDGAPRG